MTFSLPAAVVALALAAPSLPAGEAAGPTPPPAPPGQAEERSWPAGTTEWGLLAGVGPGKVYDPPRTPTRMAQAALRWARHFGPLGEYGGAGNLAIVVEGVPLYTLDQDPRAYGAGVNLLLRYTLRRGSWLPSVLVGAGMVGTNTQVPPGETKLNFTPQGGLALQYLIRPRTAVGVEYRFHHLSNASRTNDNPGINSHLLMIGVSWFR